MKKTLLNGKFWMGAGFAFLLFVAFWFFSHAIPGLYEQDYRYDGAGLDYYNPAADMAPSFGTTNGVGGGGSKGDPSFVANDAMAPGQAEGDAGEDAGDGRKLVATATLRAETKSFDEYGPWLRDRVEAHGGYIERSEAGTSAQWDYYRNGISDGRYASYGIRVPADRLDAFLSDIDGMGSVTYRNLSVQDITEAYTDTDAHVGALRVEQGRLVELLGQAETVDEILAIEDRLAYVRYELESYERQLRGYDSQVAYSRVSLEVREVVEYTEQEERGFLERCWDGVKANIEAVRAVAAGLVLWIVTHTPAMATLAILGACAWKIALRVRRNRKERLAEAAREDQDQSGE